MKNKPIKTAPKPNPLDRLLKKAVKKIEKEKVKPRVKPKQNLKTKPAKPASSSQVKKKTEYEWMMELVQNGLWRTSNLAEVIGIDRETVTKWKSRAEIKEIRRSQIVKTLKKGRSVETILKEMGVETDPDKLEITHKFETLGDHELDNLIASKAGQVGVVGATAGEGAPKSA